MVSTHQEREQSCRSWRPGCGPAALRRPSRGEAFLLPSLKLEIFSFMDSGLKFLKCSGGHTRILHVYWGDGRDLGYSAGSPGFFIASPSPSALNACRPSQMSDAREDSRDIPSWCFPSQDEVLMVVGFAQTKSCLRHDEVFVMWAPTKRVGFTESTVSCNLNLVSESLGTAYPT